MYATGGLVYILTNTHKNVLYIGVTSNLIKRIEEHEGHVFPQSFSAKYNVENLVYYEFYFRIEDAIKRERQLKKWTRIKKENLIQSKNPEWRFLNDEVRAGIYTLLDEIE